MFFKNPHSASALALSSALRYDSIAASIYDLIWSFCSTFNSTACVSWLNKATKAREAYLNMMKSFDKIIIIKLTNSFKDK